MYSLEYVLYTKHMKNEHVANFHSIFFAIVHFNIPATAAFPPKETTRSTQLEPSNSSKVNSELILNHLGVK